MAKVTLLQLTRMLVRPTPCALTPEGAGAGPNTSFPFTSGVGVGVGTGRFSTLTLAADGLPTP